MFLSIGRNFKNVFSCDGIVDGCSNWSHDIYYCSSIKIKNKSIKRPNCIKLSTSNIMQFGALLDSDKDLSSQNMYNEKEEKSWKTYK